MAERIYLIGPRGSGKTTVAGALAQALAWNWLDADRVLEEQAGCTIRSLFESEGEAGFRDREQALLRELSTRERCVIATGGGIVLRAENRDLLRSTGRVVRLVADVSALCQRLAADAVTQEQRPSLTGRSAIDPAEIAQVVTTREPLYAATADFTVDTTNLSTSDIVTKILGLLDCDS